MRAEHLVAVVIVTLAGALLIARLAHLWGWV